MLYNTNHVALLFILIPTDKGLDYAKSNGELIIHENEPVFRRTTKSLLSPAHTWPIHWPPQRTPSPLNCCCYQLPVAYYVQHCCHNYLLFGRVGEPATHAASFSAARDESLRVERVSPPTPSSNYPSVKFVILIAMQLISSLSRTKGVLIERLLSR